MLSMGAELGQSQHGNNNAYAQDNATAWLDWDKADARLIDFTRALIALRRENPAFTQDRFLTGAPTDSGLPDVEWRGADGDILRDGQWQDGERRFLAAFFHADGSRAAVLLNAGRDEAPFRLPQPRDNFLWRRALDTQAEDGAGDGACFDCGETLIIAPRSSLVLVETREDQAHRLDAAPQPETLDALARAAGLAPDWHDINGTRHVVPEATKRALLKAMGLPAETQREARASLKGLAAARDRRALPFTLVVREGERIEAPLAIDAPRAELELVDESGARRRIQPEAFRREDRRACDGGVFAVQVATLPPLAIGRYRLSLADDPASFCHLTVAPRACFWPAALDARATGLSAQLYSLRRDGDQGIGDFTTLAELAEAAGRAGYATLGINPLHALFTQQRERASPYHPSDRNFLDPISLDLDALTEITGLPCPLDAETRARAKALAEKSAVDYPAVWALKAQALAAHFSAFEQAAQADRDFAPARDFDAFLTEGGARLQLFAAFEFWARRGKTPPKVRTKSNPSPRPMRRTSARSVSSNGCATASWRAPPRAARPPGFRLVSIAISPSARRRTAARSGPNATCSCTAPRSARRPILSRKADRSGDCRRPIRWRWRAAALRPSKACCAPTCATPARCASIMSWRCSGCSSCPRARRRWTAPICPIRSTTCSGNWRWRAFARNVS